MLPPANRAQGRARRRGDLEMDMPPRYRCLWTMPYEKDPAEPDYWVSFYYTPPGKPNGHYHANDPDTPEPALVEDIHVEMPEEARKHLDSQPETWPELEAHCREAGWRQSTGRERYS